jgi:hypothetical protein
MTYTPEYRRILNRMGYYGYQRGLIYRHLNQEGGWDEHLQRCRDYILNSIESIKPEKVTILGSGWLLDLPLAEICEKAQKVVLIDIVHPPEVAKQVKDLKNVSLVEADVTGGLVLEVWNKVRSQSLFRKISSVSELTLPDYVPENDPGMVISLNILTQLESLIVDFLKRKTRINENELRILRSEIQNKHLAFLQKHTSILISDTEEEFIGKNGNSNVVPTLLTSLPEGTNAKKWTWGFDLKGSDFNTSRSRMKVIAITYDNEKGEA